MQSVNSLVLELREKLVDAHRLSDQVANAVRSTSESILDAKSSEAPVTEWALAREAEANALKADLESPAACSNSYA